jgi:beta-1,4-mannosyl-glycoprotein beta-1,4-N-acetylglucosaminyltransferase
VPRYDCFAFFNELDILEIRLKTMAEVIDTFVIVEAPWTFQGATKPLYFNDNRRRFRHYLPRIRHIVVEDLMAYDNPWHREYYQRNALRRGLMDALPTIWSSSLMQMRSCVRPPSSRPIGGRYSAFCE